jgi:hypothetical protein
VLCTSDRSYPTRRNAANGCPAAPLRRGLRTETPWGAAALERGKPILGFFDTLQSRYGEGRSRREGACVRTTRPPRQASYPSPREEASWKHEAETRGGKPSRGDKARRGSTDGHRVTPAHAYGSAGCINPWSRARVVFGRCVKTARRAARVERRGGYRRGDTSGSSKPMGVTGMKQGRKVVSGIKASRG